jgi:predicted GH43/DUF377 family glycosyl hydrolase
MIFVLLILLLAGCQVESTSPAVSEVPATEEMVANNYEPVAVTPPVKPEPTTTAAPPPTEPPPTATPESEGIEGGEPETADDPDRETAMERFRVAGLFAAYSQEPVINLDTEEVLNWEFPGAVIFHDGQFHMFANVISWWPQQVAVHYLTSQDGIEWTPAAAEPIFTGEMLQGANTAFFTAFASSVLVEDDGTWVLYYSTVDRPTDWPPVFEGGIGRATAPYPSGPWTPDDDLVLRAGGEDDWDSLGVRDASVLRVDDGYVMYYSGYKDTGSNVEGGIVRANSAIGRASSDNGVTWTKLPEPVLSGSGESGAWDEYDVQAPRVVRTPDGWVMAYSSSIQTACCMHKPGIRKHGMAVSDDGLNWVCSDDVIFSPSREFGVSAVWEKALAYHEGSYFLYMQAGKVNYPDISWSTYLATYDGVLAP